MAVEIYPPTKNYYCIQCGALMKHLKSYIALYNPISGDPIWQIIYSCPNKTKSLSSMFFGGHSAFTDQWEEHKMITTYPSTTRR